MALPSMARLICANIPYAAVTASPSAVMTSTSSEDSYDFYCQLYAGFVSSVNGGASWSSNVQLAGPMSLKWLAKTTDGYMTGDYISTSIVGAQAFPAIAVAFVPQHKKLQEFMYTAALNVVGGPIRVTHNAVVVTP